GLDQDVGLGNEDDFDHAPVDLATEIPTKPPRGGPQAFVGLLEGEQDPLLTGQGAAVDELQRQDRLAGAGDAADEQARAPRDAGAENLVELGDVRLAARLRPARRWLAADRQPRGEDLDAAAGDQEWVLVAAMVRAAHLDDLEQPLLLAKRLALRQDQQAVDDREQRIPVVVANAVFAEQQ